MPSESGERRPGRVQQVGAHQAETEHLPCPRCNSTNTKFCYYNNYNLSQPRHFCKACRRYWTQGGTLRNIPVGGGTRKNSKRSRTSSPSTSSSHHDLTTPAISVKPEMLSPSRGDMNLNDNVPPSFTSLLNPQGTGLLALGGFGLGLGPGFDEMGFGLGRGVWPLEQVGEGGCGGASGGNTWQISAVDGGFADGECFAWPDLAISTPGQGLK